MTDPDIQAVASVINRLGAHELTDVLKVIFERLERIEEEIFPPPGGGVILEAKAGTVADETVPQTEEGTQALGEGQSSSSPVSESATQTQGGS